MKYIVVDLDGTLALIEHRLHHIKKKPADWWDDHKAVDRAEKS